MSTHEREIKMLSKEGSERSKESYGVVAKNFSLFRAGRPLIKQANFAISPGRKVGLIGRNGGGKTTFLETILAVKERKPLPSGVETEGQLLVLPLTRIGYLPQEVKINFSGTVEDYLDFCANEVADTYHQWEEIQRRLEIDTSRPILDEYGEVLERMTTFDVWNYPQKKERILSGLGLDSNYLKRGITDISGGEAARVALAGVLISSPNLILLDEPTNNLDFSALKFLKEWISGSAFSSIIVSHDRRFLDETVGEILEIDEETQRVFLFGGNYSFYAQVKKEMFEAQQRAYEEQKRKREQLEKSAQELEAKARQFEEISRNAFYRAKGAGLARQAKVQLERIRKELSQIPEPKPPKKPAFPVLEIQPSMGSLINFSKVTFGYPGEKKILEAFSFSMKEGEKVAIVGLNGAGKTTFLRLVVRELKPQKGTINVCQKVAYLPQVPKIEGLSLNVIDYFRQYVAVGEEEAREFLGRVLFQDISGKKLGDLSMGEIRRIQLAMLFAQRPNLIILDEPTNHLDIFTIEMLEEALKKFKGGMLVVSHDEMFLRNIRPERFLIFLGRGKIQEEKEFPNLEEIFAKTAQAGKQS